MCSTGCHDKKAIHYWGTTFVSMGLQAERESEQLSCLLFLFLFFYIFYFFTFSLHTLFIFECCPQSEPYLLPRHISKLAAYYKPGSACETKHLWFYLEQIHSICIMFVIAPVCWNGVCFAACTLCSSTCKVNKCLPSCCEQNTFWPSFQTDMWSLLN